MQSIDITGATCTDSQPHPAHRIAGSFRGSCTGTPASLGDPGQPGRRYATPANPNATLETYVHAGRNAVADATRTPACRQLTARVVVRMTEAEYAAWRQSSSNAAKAWANRDRYVHTDHVAESSVKVAADNDGGPAPADLSVKFQSAADVHVTDRTGGTYDGTVAAHETTRDGRLVYGVRDRYRVVRWHNAADVYDAAADLRDKRIAGF